MTTIVQPALNADHLKRALNTTLRNLTKGSLDFDQIMSMSEQIEKLEVQVGKLKKDNVKLRKSAKNAVPVSVNPKSKLTEVKINGLTLPKLEWTGKHAYVEEHDPLIIEDKAVMNQLYRGIAGNQNTWLFGPPGCGKDVSINQVSAELGLPIFRVSCDADIGRAELVGRDQLVIENGATTSKFVEGVVVRAMREPCLLVIDEADFMREEVAYVLQTVLNEGKITLLEQGGEVVTRHPHCYVIATANTNGLNDKYNRYPGSRRQSMAFLDRFNNWIQMDYMDSYEELVTSITGSCKSDVMKLSLFIQDYHRDYRTGSIETPLTNRAIVTICNNVVEHKLDYKAAIRDGVESTLLARMEGNDHSRILELLNKRVGS